MVDTYDHLFKFLIIGNAGVGKTCILKRFLDNTFKEISLHTIGVEFGTKIISVNEKLLKLQIWDTAGQERFQCVTRSYYRGAVGALIVYDITNRDSFNQVANWLSNARDLASQGLVVILVGNKVDLADRSREVTDHEARKFAEENNIIAFVETSAKSGDNVSEAFIAAANKVLDNTLATNPTELIQPSLNGTALLMNSNNSSNRNCSC